MGSYSLVRLVNFRSLESHALRYREFKGLSLTEIAFAEELIDLNSGLSVDDYIQKLNRLTITDERVRVKNRTKIWGLLLEAATAENQPIRRRR